MGLFGFGKKKNKEKEETKEIIREETVQQPETPALDNEKEEPEETVKEEAAQSSDSVNNEPVKDKNDTEAASDEKEFRIEGNVLKGGGIDPAEILVELVVPEGVEVIASGAYKDKKIYRAEFPDSLKRIESDAFRGSEISSVKCWNGLEEIGESAFKNSGIGRTELPCGLKKIGAEAFDGCDYLHYMIIPDTVTEIGDEAFGRTVKLIGKKSIIEGYVKKHNGYFYEYTDSDGSEEPENFVIPDESDLYIDEKGKLISYYGDDKYIILPDRIKAIDECVFSGLNIRKIRLPEKLREIGEKAFEYTPLTEISIPDSVRKIGNDCFSNCKNLKSVRIGSGLKKIPEYAFYHCISLTNINISADIESIGEYAFAYTNIMKMRLPNSINIIGGSAFSFIGFYSGVSNVGMESIFIPESVTRIGKDAFLGDPKLTVKTTKVEDSYVQKWAKRNKIKCEIITDDQESVEPIAITKKEEDHDNEVIVKVSGTSDKMDYDSMKVLEGFSFDKNQYTVINDDLSDLQIPIPDGYHYNIDESGPNDKWFYIIPENVSLKENHIDAKPFGIGIALMYQTNLPMFEAKNIDTMQNILMNQYNMLQKGNEVLQQICSNNCAFLCQLWFDELGDLTYNKLNGLLLAGHYLMQFHILANHDEGIAKDAETVAWFLHACRMWMKKVRFKPDEEQPLPQADPDDVKFVINSACDAFSNYSKELSIPPEIGTELREQYKTIAALFYRENGLSIDDPDAELFASMVIDDNTVSKKTVCDELKKKAETLGSIEECLKEYSSVRVINQFIKCDKVGKIEYGEGMTGAYSDSIKEMLIALCSQKGLDFYANDYCSTCMTGLEEVIKDKWNTTNYIYFPGNGSQEASAEIPAALNNNREKDSAGSYKKLSDTISVKSDDNELFLINDEWNFRLPKDLEYAVDSEFDGGLNVGVDLTGSVKPLIIKGLKKGTDYLFNFDLEQHHDFFGNYYSVTDCKYDNRVADADSNAKQLIISDGEDLYVDIMLVNTWPFGIDMQIRVRGSEITPYNFATMAKGCDENDIQRIVDKMKEIASSICLKGAVPSVKKTRTEDKKKKAPAKTNTPKADPKSDPNCVVDGTVLKKYIGSNMDVVLPDGLTEIADNTFSGRDIHSVFVPEGVKTIGTRVFENCFELEEASLPSTLKELGRYSFVDCHKLKKIKLGDSLTAIESSMFSECFELENVVIPKKVKYIDAFAFQNCKRFTSIVIPDGVESIGANAFRGCTNLSYMYIPASVKQLCENLIGDTPFGDCDSLTIHCPAGSAAEDYCKSHGMSYVIDDSPVKVKQPVLSVSKPRTGDGSLADDMEAAAGDIEDMYAQISEMQAEGVSEEEQEKLEEMMEQLGDLKNQLDETTDGLSRYGSFLEQIEARDKALEEEKARKKAEAMAAGKSEKDIVNMYIILDNEKKLGLLQRKDEEFFSIYEEDFPAFTKDEVIKTRAEMIEAMKDEFLCKHCEESFKQRSVKDRFETSTRNLKNVSTEPDFGKRMEFAIENTKEWYKPEEYDEVRKLMDADAADVRRQLDEQCEQLEEKWKKYSTAEDCLLLWITDKEPDDSDMRSEWSCFQVVVGKSLVTVKMSTKGFFEMTAYMMNVNPWYWGVTILDIWEAAYKNDVRDNRDGKYDGDQVAKKALDIIRSKYPDRSR